VYDLCIHGGTVVDGTGAAAYQADIGVTAGKIDFVGRLHGSRARRRIDATGALVCPGFIDGHTHYDGQVTWEGDLEGSASNGVTTVLMGNCGVGFAPVRPSGYRELIGLMEGVEDIPGSALSEGIPWGEWETFPEYLAFLGRRTWATEVAAQVAHGPLRYYAMGERALEHAVASEDDMARLRAIAREAITAGALGFSTSRVLSHRSVSGSQVPGTFAEEAELLAIAEGIRDGGGGIIQAIPSNCLGDVGDLGPAPVSLDDELWMYSRISRRAGLRFVFTTLQNKDAPQAWRRMLAITAEETARGALLTPMVAPRAVSMVSMLDGYHIFMLRPTYRRLAGLPVPRLVEELARPEIKQAILSEADEGDEAKAGTMEQFMPRVLTRYLDRSYQLTPDRLDYEPAPERSIVARAAASGRDVMSFLYDLLLERQGSSAILALGANYIDGNLDACGEMLENDQTVVGLSDAGAHTGILCDMSNPTFTVSYWTRDRDRGARLPLETAIAKQTWRLGQRLGMNDRGAIRPGLRADLNVIDYDRLNIGFPEVRHDLPTGGRRLLQLSSGYLATIVGGVPTRINDLDTGERPGRLVTRTPA
jgi:N-acyl-D-amino-acid deacylase